MFVEVSLNCGSHQVSEIHPFPLIFLLLPTLSPRQKHSAPLSLRGGGPDLGAALAGSPDFACGARPLGGAEGSRGGEREAFARCLGGGPLGCGGGKRGGDVRTGEAIPRRGTRKVGER